MKKNFNCFYLPFLKKFISKILILIIIIWVIAAAELIFIILITNNNNHKQTLYKIINKKNKKNYIKIMSWVSCVMYFKWTHYVLFYEILVF